MTDKNTELTKKDDGKFMENAKFSKSGLEIRTFDDLWRFSQLVSSSGLCPDAFRGNAGDVFIACEWGLELGLTPMNALNSIAVIKGRPALFGDAVKGLVDNSGLMESYEEEFVGEENTDSYGVQVTSKRKDKPKPLITTFTVAKAKLADLWDSSVTWKKYPYRMLKYRSRAFNLRDNFPDVLKGIHIAEEVADYEVIDTEQPQTMSEVEDEILGELDGNVEDAETTPIEQPEIPDPPKQKDTSTSDLFPED